MKGDENIPKEMQAQWHKFVDEVNNAVEACFDVDADHPIIVLGAQWGSMGKADSDLPDCVVTSNLPVCLVPDALLDMMTRANADHDEHHGLNIETDDEGMPLGFPMDADSVPDSVREQALKIAESLGLPPEAITYLQVPNTSDLEDPQGALNIPLPGDPTTVEGTDAD